MAETIGIISSVFGAAQGLMGLFGGDEPKPPPPPSVPFQKAKDDTAKFKLGSESDVSDRVAASRKKPGTSASIVDAIGGLGQGGLKI